MRNVQGQRFFENPHMCSKINSEDYARNIQVEVQNEKKGWTIVCCHTRNKAVPSLSRPFVLLMAYLLHHNLVCLISPLFQAANKRIIGTLEALQGSDAKLASEGGGFDSDSTPSNRKELRSRKGR